MIRLRLALLALLVSSFAAGAVANSGSRFFPAAGDTALYQLTRDVAGDINVLCIAIQPGYEDLSSLAYFRLAKGAKILAAYITNGESGESDIQSEYPAMLAAVRREEAAAALAMLDGEARFMNLPDIASASDSAAVRSLWHTDSLQLRLRQLIGEFKPDLILISPDFGFSNSPLRTDIVVHDVLAAARQVSGHGTWSVDRVALESPRDKGFSLPIDDSHPKLKVTYRAIAEAVTATYQSLAVQRGTWRTGVAVYRVLHPATFTGTGLDTGLPVVSDRLRTLNVELRQFSHRILASKNRNSDEYFRQAASLLDSVSMRITRIHQFSSAERRTLLRWKGALEGIRNVLLGVKVDFTVSDSILTDLQLTYLNVSRIHGLSDGGTTELFFPAVDAGWVLNEDVGRRIPFEPGEAYRLLTPSALTYDFPRAEFGNHQQAIRKPTYFFIIHNAKDRSRSFIYRGSMYFSFSPKLSFEVLTPIVRAMNDERVTVRLMNHSWDGVRDTVHIRDSVMFAPGRPFRLSYKGATQLDTLRLQLHTPVPEGDHLSNILIDDVPQGMFVARSFSVRADTSQAVAVTGGVQNSATVDALRRIGFRSRELRPADLSTRALEGIDVLILDRRSLTLHTRLKQSSRILERFVERGGHLVVLAQESDELAKFPLLEGIVAAPSHLIDEAARIAFDSTHRMLAIPNPILPEDFDGWLFRKAHNSLTVRGEFEIPVRGPDEEPLVVSRLLGKGRITYVDLALHHQWMNVHPGSLRLLANLVAFH
ncbi:MAG: PIG-L family deacetylase [Bacteroidetes bacterium]|nr:PIG-L family deacetylase [Bacteroidota bacterium]MCW5896370.1 PIG-L family deacetylase [Bacteroidota bacterium]